MPRFLKPLALAAVLLGVLSMATDLNAQPEPVYACAPQNIAIMGNYRADHPEQMLQAAVLGGFSKEPFVYVSFERVASNAAQARAILFRNDAASAAAVGTVDDKADVRKWKFSTSFLGGGEGLAFQDGNEIEVTVSREKPSIAHVVVVAKAAEKRGLFGRRKADGCRLEFDLEEVSGLETLRAKAITNLRKK